MSEQLEYFNQGKSKLCGSAKDKLEESLRKNPDFIKFTTNNDLDHQLKTLYAPLTSVDVERSFSLYKNILKDRRQRLTPLNIEMMNVIQFNTFLKN